MNENVTVTINVSLHEANIILESLGMNRLNDILPLYMKVRGQIEVQLQSAQVMKDGVKEHTKQ